MVHVSSEREPQVKGLKLCVSAIILILDTVNFAEILDRPKHITIELH